MSRPLYVMESLGADRLARPYVPRIFVRRSWEKRGLSRQIFHCTMLAQAAIQGCAVPPKCCAFWLPHAPLRGACGVLDPAGTSMTATPRLSEKGEGTMITLEQHIFELRAELRGCRMTRRERADTEAELAKANEQQIERDLEFDKELAADIRGRGG